MRAPKNRRVLVVGYQVLTPLGPDLETTWALAEQGTTRFHAPTRCRLEEPYVPVGELEGWDPGAKGGASAKDVANWNAAFVLATVAVCKAAVHDSGIELRGDVAARTACLMGSALNGHDAFRVAVRQLEEGSYLRVSPFLLPNLCSNVPAGQAGAALGFTGPIFAPGGACASGNHALGIGARLIRDGDVDFAVVGGIDMPIVPEIVVGFANMNAAIKLRPGDRAYDQPGQASRPFSLDRKGFVLAEGAGALVLAADEAVRAHGLVPRAEVLGIGWNSDAHHFTRLNPPTVARAMREALDDAELVPNDVACVNAHGTSTGVGDAVEAACLRQVFGERIERLPISANKSMLGHSLGGAAAIEAVLAIEGMRRGVILPTANYLPDPELSYLDVVAEHPRRQAHELTLSNAFGFGGTNCCVVLRGL